MSRMNSEIKQLWVNALRSGEYTQGSGGLNKDSCFCIMGVLCDIHRKVQLKSQVDWVKPEGCVFAKYFGEGFYIPIVVLQWSGLKSVLGTIITIPDSIRRDYKLSHLSNRYFLVELNDIGIPFEVLAKLIEEQL